MISTATTWDISHAQFFWGYGILCVVAALFVWQQWRSALGPKERGNDPQPELGPYKLAMLSGGPQLAITAAATKLHRDGLLEAGPSDGTLVVSGELEPGAERLERAVFDTVKQEPCLTTAAMRAELEDSEPVRWMKDELVDAGLLLDDSRSAAIRGLWLVGAVPALLGIAGLAAGLIDDTAAAGSLLAMVGVVAGATLWLAQHRPLTTNRGSAIVKRQRQAHHDLRRNPTAGESVLAASLFGGGALWLADPAIASTLGVPREEERGWSRSGGGGYGAGCSAGGGCGSGSSCGGGGCGGGGCGGGGG
jgi:uncharacterized protein (TIGR04222 family)